ncbi:MAG: M28 family peptidase, partial [Bacteroidota bacterium]
VLALLILFTVIRLNGQTAEPEQYRIQPDALRAHIAVLGADSLEGRGTGTTGCEKAAAYVTRALRTNGISPYPVLKGYEQLFPLHGSTPDEGTEFTLYAPKDSYTLRIQEDYVLFSAGAQTFTPLPVKMIFVGYGIIAPEFDYNDYQNIDVRNAIVVFLSGEPASSNDSYFDGEHSTVHSSFVEKQKTALARGARGSILIPNTLDRSFDDWYEQQRHFRFEEVRQLSAPSENLNILLNPKLVPFLFTDAPYSFDEITAMEKTHSIKSFPLVLRGSFHGKFREREFLSSNIIGYVEGSDPALKDSYLLLTAHYDHLGIGIPVEGDSIYNGVFDNASGVAALLEIARVFSLPEHRPKRSVLFIFLTGEERGFIGSQYYCLNPVVPLYRTIANINIDGISLFERTRSVIGVGAELSSLGRSLKESVRSMDLAVDEIPQDVFRQDQFRNSDQFIFAQAGIPSILIAEGLQYETSTFEQGLQRYTAWTEERYHTPFDDLSQKLNMNAAEQHTSVILHFAQDLANGSDKPSWNPHSPFLSARLRSASEKK